MESYPGDEPLAVQLVGQDIEKILPVAKICEEKGFPLLDLNAGCPARKVVSCGKGSALLKEPKKLANIIGTLVKALNIPVSVKIRSGWDEDSLNYLEIAKIIEGEGAKSVCVHTRTKKQMYKGKTKHNIIREIKEEVNIPVFASGNMFTPEDVSSVIKETGCDGVFIARGALGCPWIFNKIDQMFLGEASYGEPDFKEVKDVIVEHFKMAIEFYGEFLAFKRMYKHMTWYLKRHKNLNEVMKRYREIENSKLFETFLSKLEVNERNRLEF